jgi:hypothetical protein
VQASSGLAQYCRPYRTRRRYRRKIDDAKIDAKPILGGEFVGFGNVARGSEYPLAAHKAKINFAWRYASNRR